MTDEPLLLETGVCVFCRGFVPLDTYLANDHTCTPCGEKHLALLEGQVPRLKD